MGGDVIMYIDQLVYFLHVAETGSMNSAAQKFYMTQQAINASLKKMEAELDTPLINRSNKGVTLTPQGYIFAEYAKSIVQQYEEAVHELQRFNAAESNLHGTLSVFSASIFTNLFLPGVIRDFTQIYPNTRIKIIETGNEELLSYVMNDYCELALFSASKDYIEQELAERSAQKIKLLSLMEDKVVLCMRPDHPLSKLKTTDSEAQYHYAQKEKLEYSFYQILSERLTDEVYTAMISNSSNAELHKKLIMEGVAVTYMPQLAYQLEFKHEGFTSVLVEDCLPVNHCVVYHDNPESEYYQLVQVFLQFLQKQFQKRFGMYIPGA